MSVALGPETAITNAASAGPARIELPVTNETMALAAVSSAGVVTSCGRREACVGRISVTPHRPSADRIATTRNGHSSTIANPPGAVRTAATR
jgi:hypothetical protein